MEKVLINYGRPDSSKINCDLARHEIVIQKIRSSHIQIYICSRPQNFEIETLYELEVSSLLGVLVLRLPREKVRLLFPTSFVHLRTSHYKTFGL